MTTSLESPGGLVKAQMTGPYIQRFRFSRYGWGPWINVYNKFSGALRTTVLVWPVSINQLCLFFSVLLCVCLLSLILLSVNFTRVVNYISGSSFFFSFLQYLVAFHRMNIAHLTYSFCWWISESFIVWCYYEQCCYEYSYTCFWWTYALTSLYINV